uniref:Integrator complex subunit 4/Protein SIEL C-terminal Ig-like domain-containing protein n=1 Tax=Rhizophora mucronata TaxID=61149 RepID=A0A2P2PN39_RHIMU
MNLCSTIRHIKAELTVPGNDSENPLSFVSGLPVGIPLDIALHSVSSENRLWLRITRSENSTQFVSLDTNLCNGSNEVNRLTFTAPFYRTPKASSFTLRVCIGMECLFEDIHVTKGYAGPKHVLVYLCQEKNVYLRMV